MQTRLRLNGEDVRSEWTGERGPRGREVASGGRGRTRGERGSERQRGVREGPGAEGKGQGASEGREEMGTSDKDLSCHLLLERFPNLPQSVLA